jgi:HD-like signal output (HDOD) protein
MDTLSNLLHDVRGLISLPEVCLRVNAMVNDNTSSANDIGEVVARDPSLTARLLRIANSPFYGFSRRIDTVGRAISVIGTKQLRDLVLATSAVRTFNKIPNTLVSMEDFWSHSVLCGIAARALAARLSLSHSDSLFVAGLLHDIGQLVIFSKLPEKAREALALAADDPVINDLHAAEQKILGFDHGQVGGLLLQHWRVPTVLQECAGFHHIPDKAREYPLEVAIVHLANTVAAMAEINTTDFSDVPPIQEVAWTLTGLSEADLLAAHTITRDLFDQTYHLFVAEAA